MGSPEDEAGREDHEGPRHQVTISSDFYMGKYEVTQAQWKAVMGNNPSADSIDAQQHGTFGIGNDHPVYYVSWNDCQSFIEKLNKMHFAPGQFRLPTDAEWEYACRAGTTTRFYWGDDPDYNEIGRYAWYQGNSESQAHAVGQKVPNAWGLCDMSGNVYEWCGDGPREYSSTPQVDPVGSVTSSQRALRGGGWYQAGYYCRSAFNHSYGTVSRYIGLRLVLDRP